ncbi:oxidoreductase family protein [Stieleria varia]|uniref:CHK kinase-like domain-containing protein n=1 Tax=Stieleria varia TaxID=2528005 RepID=A0A5C6ALG5_9BACT|nr:oxidoreductase family protein [Stieleria varia]TWU00873.1 hypothetical protein Pla52n_42420 [Stieleria varia]
MDDRLLSYVCEAVAAKAVDSAELVQTLWSGYGQIVRVGLVDAPVPSVIVKHVSPPSHAAGHPRGWDTDISHCRKMRSYEVERAWYRDWSDRCDPASPCRVPRCLAVRSDDTGHLLVLEDLDAVGYAGRHHRLTDIGVHACLGWLASFHATFLEDRTDSPSQNARESWHGLWPVGTYWHLATRPDELAVMENGDLKRAAGRIDQVLSDARFQTLVHGDAKVANFCFSLSQREVAAVDFQYVGGGCGMKDVAYFLGSCLSEAVLQDRCDDLLDDYFEMLRESLVRSGKSSIWTPLHQEWSDLFSIGWADFHRFLMGWCPSHAKLTGFSSAMVNQALKAIVR